MKREKHLGIRIDETTLKKLYYIAKYEGRSGSGQIIYLIHKCIRDFEREHEEIEIAGDDNASL